MSKPKSKTGREKPKVDIDEERARFEAKVREAEAQIAEHSRRIKFYLTEYSVELLAAKMENGDFEIPNYQREDVWEPSRKSRFIESLLIGLPIPFLFFWEQPETGKLEIVDGAQRLRAIQQFMLKGFRVGRLSLLTEMEGLAFDDLLPSRQRKLKNSSIRGIILNEHADKTARYELFNRINTGSKHANSAEIRRGTLDGPFQDLVIKLAGDDRLRRLAPLPEKKAKEREWEELVTRFFGYGDGLDDYRDRPSQFLFRYVDKMNARFSEDEALAESYASRFHSTMEFIERVFPHGFRRNERGTATPRSRFESIAVGSWLALEERPDLAEVKAETLATDWVKSKPFTKIVGSDGANGKGRLTGRIQFTRKKLLGVKP